MKALVTRSALFFTAFLIGVSAAAAQTNGPRVTELPKSDKSLPFAIGEKLTYEGKLSKIISGISVADLVMTVKGIENTDDLLIEAEARSKGTLLKLFRFTFLQQISSTVENGDFVAMRTVKHDVQKERVRDSEAAFDYGERRVTYTEVNPKEPMRPPRTIASELNGKTHDIISGIYQLRLLPLRVGESFEMAVSDSGLVYNIPVKVTARERQKTALGKIWCFRVEPAIFGPGRFIEQEGSMTIWITDDARRIPMRSVVKTSFGKLDIKLKSAANLK